MSVHRALARVNVAAIERNCARLCRELRPGVQLCAVVKADGYGHGAPASARAALAGGATWLAVAGGEEALELSVASRGERAHGRAQRAQAADAASRGQGTVRA